MKLALAIRHVAFEDLGGLEPLLSARGYQVRYVEAESAALAAIDPLQAALLIVLGGPIGAYDEAEYPFLLPELALIQTRLAARLPVLGICLGAQLMARALGAAVAPMGRKEIGFAPLNLTPAAQGTALQALPAEVPVLHWHGDMFQLPEGCASLAASEVCPNQAFALEGYALALQFHLEAEPQKIEHWLVGHACELAQAGVSPSHLRSAAIRHGAALRAAAEAVFGRWLDGLEAC